MRIIELTVEEKEALRVIAGQYFDEKKIELTLLRQSRGLSTELSAEDIEVLEEQAIQKLQRLEAEALKEKNKYNAPFKAVEYLQNLPSQPVSSNFTAAQYWNMAIGNLNRIVAYKKPGATYNVTEETSWMLELLCCYFAQDKDFYWYTEQVFPNGKRRLVVDGDCSLQKGLGMFSPTGVGKTIFLEAFSINPRLSYAIVKAKWLAESFVADGFAGISKYYTWITGSSQKHFGQNQIALTIDDAGNEIHCKHFGNVVETFESVTYERWERLPAYATHFTTNLKRTRGEKDAANITTLQSRYGSRFMSRMQGNVNLLKFPTGTPDFRLL